MKYFEIDFENEYGVCIKGVREPSVGEADTFCAHEVERNGKVTAVYPIEREEAIHFYDLDNEANWPVFGV